MTPLSTIYAFPLPRRTFRLRGRKYRVRASDGRVLRLLATVVKWEPPAARSPFWLLRFRDQFREIVRLRPTALLSYVILRTGNRSIQRLAIWLRGRCRGTLGTETVTRLIADPDEALRKEATRALRRMRAWSTLREIEISDPNPRIRRLARQSRPEALGNRIASFLVNIHSLRHAAPSTRLVVDCPLDPTGGGVPPKSGRQIRTILSRIKRLVQKG